MTPEPSPTACPGCGAVLAAGPAPSRPHPGASGPCRSLFEVTLRGLRDEAATDPGAAATLALADDVYTAQHPVPGEVEGRRSALARLAERLPPGRDDALDTGAAPEGTGDSRPVWQTTVADVAADLDVVDLRVLVEAWARTAHDDWRRAGTAGREPAAQEEAAPVSMTGTPGPTLSPWVT